MEHAANPFYLGIRRDLVQIGFEILALGPAACHDSFERIVGPFRECQQMPGLIEHVRLIDVGFQVYGLHHVQSLNG